MTPTALWIMGLNMWTTALCWPWMALAKSMMDSEGKPRQPFGFS